MIDWTIRLLVKSSKLAGRHTYQDLVEFCFGRIGYVAISAFQFIFAFGILHFDLDFEDLLSYLVNGSYLFCYLITLF